MQPLHKSNCKKRWSLNFCWNWTQSARFSFRSSGGISPLHAMKAPTLKNVWLGNPMQMVRSKFSCLNGEACIMKLSSNSNMKGCNIFSNFKFESKLLGNKLSTQWGSDWWEDKTRWRSKFRPFVALLATSRRKLLQLLKASEIFPNEINDGADALMQCFNDDMSWLMMRIPSTLNFLLPKLFI